MRFHTDWRCFQESFSTDLKRCMQRTNIFLTEEQQKRLHRRTQEEEVSKSMLIRRMLESIVGDAEFSAQ